MKYYNALKIKTNQSKTVAEIMEVLAEKLKMGLDELTLEQLIESLEVDWKPEEW